MKLRDLFIPFKTVYNLLVDGCNPVFKKIFYGTLLIWAFWGFKKVETSIFPVVSKFEITDVRERQPGNHKEIAGILVKERDCEFQSIVGYSQGGALVVIDFGSEKQIKNRIAMENTQAWGWWAVMPPVDYITIYSVHQCYTGKVTTKLYEGEI